MKTVISLFTILSLIATNSVFAQNGVGISYSARIFPFQHYKNQSSDYLAGGQYVYKDNITVSNAIENNFSFFYEFSAKKRKNIAHQVGANYYFARLIFERDISSKEPSSYYPYTTIFYEDTKRSGVYDYGFIGFNYTLFKENAIGTKFSLRFGGEVGLNIMAHNRIYNTRNEVVKNNVSPSYTYHKTTIDENVSKPTQEKLNIRISAPVHLLYHYKKTVIGLGCSFGASTQSRILVNDKGFNLYFAPTVCYTYFLKS